MGIATGGPALSDAYGASLGRSMGEQTGIERALGNMTVMPDSSGMAARNVHAGGDALSGRDAWRAWRDGARHDEQASARLPLGDDGHARGDAGRAA
jgi:hypothetical protein